MGNIFLKLFLKILNLEHFNNISFQVYREKENIDILLLSKNRVIIIENKINTTEHSNQLERYLNSILKKGYRDEDIKIVYLTLFGDSSNSLKDRAIKISYKKEIKLWIEESIKCMAKFPTIRETLIQYLELINKLTYRDNSIGFIMEVKDLLLEDNNLKRVLDIQPAIIEAKMEIQLRFWRKLLVYLKDSGYEFKFYSINGDMSIENSVDKYYNRKKNNRDYGFEYKVYKNLYFFIEIRRNIYYGFYFNGDIKRKITDNLDRLDIRWEEPYWKYPDKRLNFEDFNQNVLDLIDSKKLENIIMDIGNDISFLIENFKKEIEK